MRAGFVGRFRRTHVDLRRGPVYRAISPLNSHTACGEVARPRLVDAVERFGEVLHAYTNPSHFSFVERGDHGAGDVAGGAVGVRRVSRVAAWRGGRPASAADSNSRWRAAARVSIVAASYEA